MKNIYPFIFIAFLLFLAGCSHNYSNISNSDFRNDSIERRFNQLIQSKHIDSLQIESQNLANGAEPESKAYFFARLFQIQSLMYSKKLDEALEWIDETGKSEKFHRYPDLEARYAYTRSRCYIYMKRYEDAIANSRELLDIQPTDTASKEVIRKTSVLALRDVPNLFFFLNKVPQGVEWFRRLRAHPPVLLEECCQRDMMICQAYLMGLEPSLVKQGEALMDSAFALPVYRETAENAMRECIYASSLFLKCPHREADMIELLKRALSESRIAKNKEGETVAFNLLANLYRRKKNFSEAVKLRYQSLQIAMQQNDSVLCSHTYSGIYNIYLNYGMYRQALFCARKAIEWKSQSLSMVSLGINYYQLYKILKIINPDYKDLHYIDLADSCLAQTNDEKAKLSCLMARAELLIEGQPDSIKRGLQLLDSVSARVANKFSQDLDVYQRVQNTNRAIAYIKLGEEAKARKAILAVKSNTDIRYEVFKPIMDYFLKKKDTEVIAHLTALREPMLDTYVGSKSQQAINNAETRYRTQQKEQQNRLLSAEIELKNSRLRAYTFGGLSVFLIGLCIGSILWMRQRSLRLQLRLEEQEKELADNRLQEQEVRLRQLIASRQELNNRNEELLRQLSEVQATHEKTCDLDHVMESLQPHLLTPNEEEQFRTAFNSLYPTALHNLRSAQPKVTRTDELLCMLILLKQTNEEIARTLGISRPSVLQNRYRLRTKLGLPEGCDLDNEVKEIMQKK